MGSTNLQRWPIVWYGVCCFGLTNRGDSPSYTVQPWILSLQLSNDKLTSTMSPLDSPQPLTKLLLVSQVQLHLQLIS